MYRDICGGIVTHNEVEDQEKLSEKTLKPGEKPDQLSWRDKMGIS